MNENVLSYVVLLSVVFLAGAFVGYLTCHGQLMRIYIGAAMRGLGRFGTGDTFEWVTPEQIATQWNEEHKPHD